MTDNTNPNEKPVVAASGALIDDQGVVVEGGIAVQGTQALLVARFRDMDAASAAYEALRDAESRRRSTSRAYWSSMPTTRATSRSGN